MKQEKIFERKLSEEVLESDPENLEKIREDLATELEENIRGYLEELREKKEQLVEAALGRTENREISQIVEEMVSDIGYIHGLIDEIREQLDDPTINIIHNSQFLDRLRNFLPTNNGFLRRMIKKLHEGNGNVEDYAKFKNVLALPKQIEYLERCINDKKFLRGELEGVDEGYNKAKVTSKDMEEVRKVNSNYLQ